jgi:beta-glucosidase-like glycosyl hydrolase
MLFINGSVVNEDGSLDEKPGAGGFGGAAKNQMLKQQMNHFSLWQIPEPSSVAAWYNTLQKLAEQTRLGIPVTIASHPRNHFSNTIFSMTANGFSQWCETPGFGALDDPDLVRESAEIAREKYVAVGIRVALHPQVDLATEPRWLRISGTFREDAKVSARLVKAYIEGFHVDESGIRKVFGKPEAVAAGLASQSRAMTLLKNAADTLQLSGQRKIFVRNMDAALAAEYARVIETPGEADFAILRLEAPWVPVDTRNEFARGFHYGDLDSKGEAKAEILALLESTPTIVVIYLDRPAVIPEISAASAALLAEYGASDESVLNVIFGKAHPNGRLSFELPACMEAVRNQKADLPYDSGNPLYPFGFGLAC